MATETANATDGYVYKTSTSNWAGARDAGTGTGNGATATRLTKGINASQVSGRGGSHIWQVYRSFFAFDTSGITGTVSSATLKIYGYDQRDADVIVIKTTRPNLSTGIANADFDAMPGFSAGATMNGNVTDYSSEFTSWATGSYNDIALNADARSDMTSGDYLSLCVVEYDHDYRNVDPGGDGNVYDSGLYYVEYSGTGTDPVLDYTLAGYGHTVIGVESGDISKVKGVATADIDKVIGVD